MKKCLLFVFSLLLYIPVILAQQPENPGFELWEDANTVQDEPTDWSSIKTSDAGSLVNNAAPVVWAQSDDAHTGTYSLELENVLTLGTIVATGMITNGRVHADFVPANGYSYTDPEDARWNTPFTSKPDSVAIWAKYFPQGTDTAQVKVLFHKGEGTLPPTPENEGNKIAYAQINIVGTYENWTKFTVPVEYASQENPEYVLIIATAGAGLLPIEGSVVRFDDMEFIYGPAGLEDHNLNHGLIYASGMTVYLGRIHESARKDAVLQVYGLDGSLILSTPVTADRVNLTEAGLHPGLYVVRVQGYKGKYSGKVFLKQ